MSEKQTTKWRGVCVLRKVGTANCKTYKCGHKHDSPAAASNCALAFAEKHVEAAADFYQTPLEIYLSHWRQWE